MCSIESLQKQNNDLCKTINHINNALKELKQEQKNLNVIVSDLKENAVVVSDLNELVTDIKTELTSLINLTPRNSDEINIFSQKLQEFERRLNDIPDIKLISKIEEIAIEETNNKRSNSRVPRLNIEKPKKK